MSEFLPNLAKFKAMYKSDSDEAKLLIERATAGLAKAFPDGSYSQVDGLVALDIEAEKMLPNPKAI
jgi:hypothetical protein